MRNKVIRLTNSAQRLIHYLKASNLLVQVKNMKFSSIAVSFVVVASVMEASSAAPLCTDYLGVYEFAAGDCNANTVVRVFKEIYDGADASLPEGCPNRFFTDLRMLFSGIISSDGTSLSVDEIKDRIDEACDAALESAISASSTATKASSWSEITTVPLDTADFFMGHGFLNLETGNFQQDPDKFDDDQFLYTGDDPRKNDHYPTTEESYQAGVDIDAFQSDVNEKKFLEDPWNFEGKCQHQAIMCCWHRDRQYKDNNGNCAPSDCVNKDPADNTNLCWTEDAVGDPTPYPGDEDEGDMHCHGLAWGSELESVNDFARFNNLFYVAMHDHMYTRGYVEAITNNELIQNIQPMCGCIEEMNPVSRADCTEAIPSTKYQLTLSPSTFDLSPIEGTFSIEFEACEGFIYDQDLDPEDLELEEALEMFVEKSNDLSAFVFRLYLEGKMTEGTMFSVFETLVGFEDPNDNENEEACEAAYFAKFREVYPGADA